MKLIDFQYEEEELILQVDSAEKNHFRFCLKHQCSSPQVACMLTANFVHDRYHGEKNTIWTQSEMSFASYQDLIPIIKLAETTRMSEWDMV